MGFIFGRWPIIAIKKLLLAGKVMHIPGVDPAQVIIGEWLSRPRFAVLSPYGAVKVSIYLGEIRAQRVSSPINLTRSEKYVSNYRETS